MKRNPVTVVAGLVAALSLALAGCAGTPAAAPASTPAAGGSTAQAPADAKTYQVGVSQYVAHPSLDASLVGFKKALADAGLEVTYDEKNGNADQATVTSISTTFATAGLDLVLAIATPSAQAAAQAITDTPVLFTAVTDPVAAKLVESMDAPGHNVSGTSDMNPVAEQIALVKKLKPEAKTLGIIYSSGEVNSEVQVAAAKEAAAVEGLEVVEKTVTNTGEVQQAANSLEVDAIYVPTDNNVVAGLESVIQVAETKQIPLVAGEGDSVKKGAIVTYGIDYEKLGYQTGEMAVKILTEGADVSKMPVETQKDLAVYVNKAAAERMGVTIPEDVLAGAEVVG